MFKKSILAGIYVGLSIFVNISVCGGLLGAVLFSIGLLAICYQSLFLFTGKAGYVNLKSKDEKIQDLFIILFGNIFGVMLLAIVATVANNEIVQPFCENIIEARTSCLGRTIFFKSICCGLLVDLSVWIFKQKKSIIGVLLCIPAFILSNMPHCIADVFYYTCQYNSISLDIIAIYLMTLIGNFIGCNIRRILS